MTKKLAWSKEEDERLTNVIKSRRVECNADGTSSINASWGEIAELMPKRSAKQCRERWCYNLNPAIKRDLWTPEEDAILVKAQSSLGNQWALIARHLPGRTENSVKTRHKSIARARRRKWSDEEDEIILSQHRQIGSRWDKIASRLPGRTPNGVKTRYSLLRKGLAHKKPVPGSPEQILFQPELIEKVKLDVPTHQARRPKRSRNYFNPLLEGNDAKQSDIQGTISIILEEIVDQVACENGEKIMKKSSSQSSLKKAKMSSKNLEETAASATEGQQGGLQVMNTGLVNGLQSKEALNSLLTDPSTPSEIRNALLAQSQQLMMYSNAYNNLVIQQQQQQQQQQMQHLLNVQAQVQAQSAAMPTPIMFSSLGMQSIGQMQQFPVMQPSHLHSQVQMRQQIGHFQQPTLPRPFM